MGQRHHQRLERGGQDPEVRDGIGTPDTEGVTLTGAGAAGGIYTATERDNVASGTSRPTILRYDISGRPAR